MTAPTTASVVALRVLAEAVLNQPKLYPDAWAIEAKATIALCDDWERLSFRVGFLEACADDIRVVIPKVEALEAERNALVVEVKQLKGVVKRCLEETNWCPWPDGHHQGKCPHEELSNG